MFKKIDIKIWDRKENYDWFINHNRCKINMTVNVDITNLYDHIKSQKFRWYPTLSYIVAKIVNKHDEFKMAHDKNNNVILFDEVHPRFPVFHEEDKKISIIWNKYNENFTEFYNSFLEKLELYKDKRGMSVGAPFPTNIFDLSSIPWASFTSFNCDTYDDGMWLAPVIFMGKYFKENDKILLPVSFTIHHAVCDAYHVSMFFKEFEDLARGSQNWM